MRCRAFTTRLALAPQDALVIALICSLIIREPTIKGIVWLGAPVTVMGIPLTMRFAMFDPPATEGLPPPQACAVALDVNTEAVTPIPAAVTATLATDDWEEARLDPPVVLSLRRPASSTPGTSMLANCVDNEPPLRGSGPVSEIVVLRISTFKEAPKASPV